MNTNQNRGNVTSISDQTARWRTTKQAAPILGMSERVLRDTLAKHAKSAGDMVESRFDGILGRRVGRRWKVWLSDKWTAPQGAHQERGVFAGPTISGPRSTGADGEEVDHARAS